MDRKLLRLLSVGIWIPFGYAIAYWFVYDMPDSRVQSSFAVLSLVGAAVALAGTEAGKVQNFHQPYAIITYFGTALSSIAVAAYLVSLLFARHDGWTTILAPFAFALTSQLVATKRRAREKIRNRDHTHGTVSSNASIATGSAKR